MYKDVKILPHNSDAECAVLGSCFIDFEALPKIPFLKAEDFYEEKNQWIFAAMLKLHERGEPTNQICVAYELAKAGQIDAIGGAAYISECISVTPTSVHIKYYADIVRDCSERRGKLRQSRQLVNEAYSEEPTKPSKRLKAIET